MSQDLAARILGNAISPCVLSLCCSLRDLLRKKEPIVRVIYLDLEYSREMRESQRCLIVINSTAFTLIDRMVESWFDDASLVITRTRNTCMRAV